METGKFSNILWVGLGIVGLVLLGVFTLMMGVKSDLPSIFTGESGTFILALNVAALLILLVTVIPTAQNSDSQGIPFLGWM